MGLRGVGPRGPTGGRASGRATDDLVRRLCRALDVAVRAVDRLAAAGYTDPLETGHRLRPEKVIAETAFLLRAAWAAGDYAEVTRRARDLAERLLPHARSERMLLGICFEPAVALDYAQAHICLAGLGYPDRRFDGVLRRSLQAQARDGRERPPHRVLEQEWLVRSWRGAPTRLAGRRMSAARYSVLGRPMDLLGGSREDVYAFTHALMYLADFNIRPWRPPRPVPVILAEADAALARCLDEQDYDLGGEVLLTWPLLRTAWGAGAAFGFRVLARVEDQAGFLPTPSTRLQRLERLRGDERTDYLLATAYHTVYVMGVLCAAALRSTRTRPVEMRPAAAVPGSAARILSFLDRGGARAHWRDEFDRLSDPERDAVAGVLFAIALRRKARERAFAGLREVLDAGVALGLADAPIASQAAELLERLALAAPLLSRGHDRARAPSA